MTNHGTKLKHFVVTGGNGFIGSHFCRLLALKGHKVSIIDDFSTSPKIFTHSFGTLYVGDIGDSNIWDKVCSQKVDAVFHFAAKALVGESEVDPIGYYYSNTVKTTKVLHEILKRKINNFIFSSTCATFGHPVRDLIDETHPQNPVNTYGRSKLLIEIMLKDLSQKKLMNVAILRYFNAAGCSPDGLIGENHYPETHLIPNIILSYLSGFKNPLKIFGNSFPTRDGSCIRDYIHVDDLAVAHWSAFDYLEQSKESYFDVNLGTGVGTSNFEMVKYFSEIIKKDIPYVIESPRGGDPAKLVASNEKAKKFLNFNPKYSVKEMLEHTCHYFKTKRGSFFENI